MQCWFLRTYVSKLLISSPSSSLPFVSIQIRNNFCFVIIVKCANSPEFERQHTRITVKTKGFLLFEFCKNISFQLKLTFTKHKMGWTMATIKLYTHMKHICEFLIIPLSTPIALIHLGNWIWGGKTYFNMQIQAKKWNL